MNFKSRLTIYTVSACTKCKEAKNILSSFLLPYNEINLSHYPGRRSEMYLLSKRHLLPQVFFNDIFIGGLEDLNSLDDKDIKNYLDALINCKVSNLTPMPIQSRETFVFEKNLKSCNIDENKTPFTDEDLNTLFIKLQSSGLAQDNNRHGFLRYPKTFTGNQLVNFISNHCNFDRIRSVEVGSRFIYFNLIQSIYPKFELPLSDNDDLYQFVEDSFIMALNIGMTPYKVCYHIENYVFVLEKLLFKIYSKFVSPAGEIINYSILSQSQEFIIFLGFASQLPEIDLSNLTEKEILSFFINIYNIMVIHGYIYYGYPETEEVYTAFLYKTKYIIAGNVYSLSDIRNGVLQNNRKEFKSILAPFSQTDSNLICTVKTVQPLVYFALITGRIGSPPLRVYSAESILEKLECSASNFLLSDEAFMVDVEEELLMLNSLFKCCKFDSYKDRNKLLEFIIKLMPKCSKKEDLKLLSSLPQFRLLYHSFF